MAIGLAEQVQVEITESGGFVSKLMLPFIPEVGDTLIVNTGNKAKSTTDPHFDTDATRDPYAVEASAPTDTQDVTTVTYVVLKSPKVTKVQITTA